MIFFNKIFLFKKPISVFEILQKISVSNQKPFGYQHSQKLSVSIQKFSVFIQKLFDYIKKNSC